MPKPWYGGWRWQRRTSPSASRSTAARCWSCRRRTGWDGSPPCWPRAGSAAPLGLLTVAGERGDIALSGYACGPAVHRATASGQYVVVNGRPVADPVLRTAVRIAYRHVITHGRHPVVALFLNIAPERIDVNVHPAKTELRFADVEAVRSLVIGSLGRALSQGCRPCRRAGAAVAAARRRHDLGASGAHPRAERGTGWIRRGDPGIRDGAAGAGAGRAGAAAPGRGDATPRGASARGGGGAGARHLRDRGWRAMVGWCWSISMRRTSG